MFSSRNPENFKAEQYIKMDKGNTFGDVMADPRLKTKSDKISEMLENVWNVGKLSQEEYDYFDDCIKTPTGRKIFRAQLNKYRISHRKQLNDRSFKTLKSLIWRLLDQMHEVEMNEMGSSEDMLGRRTSYVEDPTRERLETCMDCMIMSETFSKRSANQEGKTFLQKEIKYHKVWSDNELYWREIIIHSIRREINGPNMCGDQLEALFEEGFIEATVENKITWFIHDMVSYEITLGAIERVSRVISDMYGVSLPTLRQIMLLAKAKCEERSEYGFSNQINSSAALNEESETHSILIERDLKESNEETKIKIEEEKSMQGERKNTIEEEYDDIVLEKTNSEAKPLIRDHQVYLEKEHPYLINYDKISVNHQDDAKLEAHSLGKYETPLAQKLLQVEQSQRVGSYNFS